MKKRLKKWLEVIIPSVIYLMLMFSMGICFCVVAYGMGRIVGGA